MKSIANALNNIAAAIRNLATILEPPKQEVKKIENTTITSNPVKSTVTVKTVPLPKENIYTPNKQFGSNTGQLVHITKAEKEAVDAIHNAIVEKGSHPDHHDHIMRELSTKWPVLHKALLQLVKSRKESYNQAYTYRDNIWKTKDLW